VHVVVVQRHEVIRRGLSEMARRLECVDAVTSVETIARAFQELGTSAAPDVILIDDAHANCDRAEIVESFRGQPRLLLLVAGSEPRTLAAAARSVADGYLMLSSIDEGMLGRALEQVRAGHVPLPEELADYLLGQVRTGDAGGAFQTLTPRESEVIELLARGLSNKQIAVRLQISVHGVKRHVSNILSKLLSPNRAQAVAKALHAGIVTLDEVDALDGTESDESLTWAN